MYQLKFFCSGIILGAHWVTFLRDQNIYDFNYIEYDVVEALITAFIDPILIEKKISFMRFFWKYYYCGYNCNI